MEGYYVVMNFLVCAAVVIFGASMVIGSVVFAVEGVQRLTQKRKGAVEVGSTDGLQLKSEFDTPCRVYGSDSEDNIDWSAPDGSREATVVCTDFDIIIHKGQLAEFVKCVFEFQNGERIIKHTIRHISDEYVEGQFDTLVMLSEEDKVFVSEDGQVTPCTYRIRQKSDSYYANWCPAKVVGFSSFVAPDPRESGNTSWLEYVSCELMLENKAIYFYASAYRNIETDEKVGDFDTIAVLTNDLVVEVSDSNGVRLTTSA